MKPRVLIVGTVPYNKKSTSRAFESYFSGWEKENLTQIFSNSKAPCKGHCGTLFQITDHRMLRRWFDPRVKTGKIFCYDELDDQWADNGLEVGNGVIEKAYRIGQKHTPLTHLLRGGLWRKAFWCTRELNEWMDAFKPECVFLAFSDDYFINQIALYAAKRYNIPIISCIGDDYYFNRHFSLNPFYLVYKETYRALIRRVLRHPGSAIYISDKIRDKYNSEFGLNGQTVYLTSTIQRKPYSPINIKKPVITYFGNIGMGRNESLSAIASALGRIDPSYKVEVYSNCADPATISVIEKNPNALYMGSIPYANVLKRMGESDITLVVEGFADKDVELSRYSLSTKAADALASGCAIFAFGSSECGVIDYLKSTNAAEVCTDPALLQDALCTLLNDTDRQKKYYDAQILVTQKNHNLQSSCAISQAVIEDAIKNYPSEVLRA